MSRSGGAWTAGARFRASKYLDIKLLVPRLPGGDGYPKDFAGVNEIRVRQLRVRLQQLPDGRRLVGAQVGAGHAVEGVARVNDDGADRVRAAARVRRDLGRKRGQISSRDAPARHRWRPRCALAIARREPRARWPPP
jgi:hypothetical protein